VSGSFKEEEEEGIPRFAFQSCVISFDRGFFLGSELQPSQMPPPPRKRPADQSPQSSVITVVCASAGEFFVL
jgi:hypothetical protein